MPVEGKLTSIPGPGAGAPPSVAPGASNILTVATVSAKGGDYEMYDLQRNPTGGFSGQAQLVTAGFAGQIAPGVSIGGEESNGGKDGAVQVTLSAAALKALAEANARANGGAASDSASGDSQAATVTPADTAEALQQISILASASGQRAQQAMSSLDWNPNPENSGLANNNTVMNNLLNLFV